MDHPASSDLVLSTRSIEHSHLGLLIAAGPSGMRSPPPMTCSLSSRVYYYLVMNSGVVVGAEW